MPGYAARVAMTALPGMRDRLVRSGPQPISSPQARRRSEGIAWQRHTRPLPRPRRAARPGHPVGSGRAVAGCWRWGWWRSCSCSLVYVADLLTHLSTLTAMRDLVVYRDGGLITRQISPPYDRSKLRPAVLLAGPRRGELHLRADRGHHLRRRLPAALGGAALGHHRGQRGRAAAVGLADVRRARLPRPAGAGRGHLAGAPRPGWPWNRSSRPWPWARSTCCSCCWWCST